MMVTRASTRSVRIRIPSTKNPPIPTPTASAFPKSPAVTCSSASANLDPISTTSPCAITSSKPINPPPPIVPSPKYPSHPDSSILMTTWTTPRSKTTSAVPLPPNFHSRMEIPLFHGTKSPNQCPFRRMDRAMALSRRSYTKLRSPIQCFSLSKSQLLLKCKTKRTKMP